MGLLQRLIWGAVVVVTTVGAQRAHAGELEAQLDYVAAPGCPASADFASLVAKRLGYDPFHPGTSAPSETQLQVLATIERWGTTLHGRLEWRNTAGNWLGEHGFPSRTGNCGELVRAMGFSLALQMQLMAAADREEPPPSPPPPPPAAPVAAPVVTTAPLPLAAEAPSPAATISTVATPPQKPNISLGVGLAAGVGLAPDPVGIGRFFGHVAWSRVGLELAAEVTAPSTTRRPDGTGYSHYAVVASVAGCGLGSTLSACLLVRAGETRVTGKVAFPATSSALLLQGGARLAVMHPLGGGGTYIAAHADGLTTLVRQTVTIDDMPVWTSPWLSFLLGIDVGLRFQ